MPDVEVPKGDMHNRVANRVPEVLEGTEKYDHKGRKYVLDRNNQWVRDWRCKIDEKKRKRGK